MEHQVAVRVPARMVPSVGVLSMKMVVNLPKILLEVLSILRVVFWVVGVVVVVLFGAHVVGESSLGWDRREASRRYLQKSNPVSVRFAVRPDRSSREHRR